MSDSKDDSGGRTMAVARAASLGARRNSEIVKPSELVFIRTVDGNKQLGLAARRVINLMIQVAAGDAHKNKLHSVQRKILRQSHESNDRLPDILREIAGLAVEIRGVGGKGESGTWITHIFESTFRPDDQSDNAYVYFRFTDRVREILKNSETFASLEAQAILSFKSRYAMTLYEIGCQLVNRRNPSATFDIEDLRRVLHVPPDTLKDFTDLKRKVFEIAKSEIDQLAPFTFTWTDLREGRRVAAVTLTFWKKAPSQIAEAVRELDRHSVGRKARREGLVENVEVTASLPASSPPPAAAKQRLRPARGLATIAPLPGVDHEHLKAWVKASKSVIEALSTIESARKAEAEEPGAAARMFSQLI